MEDQDQIIQRIEQILDDYQLTQSEFAARIGISKAKLSHYLTQHSKPSLELIKNTLEQFEDINSDWLLLGNGPMRSIEENDKSLDKEISQSRNIDSLIDDDKNLFSDSVIDTEPIIEPQDNQLDKKDDEVRGIKNYTTKPEDSINNYTNNTSFKEKNQDHLEINIPVKTPSDSKISESRVKKIILLYNDNTYQEFSQDN